MTPYELAILGVAFLFVLVALGVLADAWERRHPWTDRGDARRRNQARRIR